MQANDINKTHNDCLLPSELEWLNSLAIDVTTISPLKEAISNSVFLINHAQHPFIFKRLSAQFISPRQRQAERVVQRYAGQHDISPVLIASNNKWLVQKYISGHSLAGRITNHKIQLLASQLYRVHNLNIDLEMALNKQDLQGVLTKLIKAIPTDTAILSHFAIADLLHLAAKCDHHSNALTLCHGDLSLSNIIKSVTDKLYIIDWEYAVMAEPAYDLAACICINQLSPSHIEDLINRYCHLAELAYEDLNPKIIDYVQVFNCINTLWSYQLTTASTQ